MNTMNTISTDIGIVTIPERNTKEEIISIINTLKEDSETLNELLVIVPHKNFWCEHKDCLEEIEPFKSEKELNIHICRCHLSDSWEVCYDK